LFFGLVKLNKGILAYLKAECFPEFNSLLKIGLISFSKKLIVN